MFTIHTYTYVHTYKVKRHKYRQTNRQKMLLYEFNWRREVALSPLSYHQDWGYMSVSLSPFLLNITISDISSNMSDQCLRSVNSSWFMGSKGIVQHLASAPCFVTSGDQNEWTMITQHELWSQEVNNDHIMSWIMYVVQQQIKSSNCVIARSQNV